jgi:hypothetical protein
MTKGKKLSSKQSRLSSRNPLVKRPQNEPKHSPPSSIEVLKMSGILPPLRTQDKFTFYYTSSLRLNLTFFSVEGPRNRRYRRTAALRLLVQPNDEDDGL